MKFLYQQIDVFFENFRNNLIDIDIDFIYYDIHSFRKNEIQHLTNERR